MKEKEIPTHPRLENVESARKTLHNNHGFDSVIGRDAPRSLLLREAEEQLRLSKARYRGIVQSRHEMICRYTPDHILTFVNDAYCRFFGSPREQLLGGSMLQQIAEQDVRNVKQALAGLKGQTPYADIEYRVHAGGRIHWTYWTHQAIYDPEGRLEEIQSIGRDISHQRGVQNELLALTEELEQRVRDRTAELEAKNRELGALNLKIRRLTRKTQETMEKDRQTLARELHDSIGASLSAIKFSLEQSLSEMTGLPDGDRLSLERLLEYLADTIKETKRISHGLRPSTLDDLGLLTTIEVYTKKLSRVFPHIHIEQSIAVEEEDVPERIKIDVYRVLQEALNNACKHSQADTIRISLKGTDDHLILEIQDNGKGFIVEETRIHNEDALNGLGLNSMRDRVEICGGVFEISSTLNQGTRLQAMFPRLPDKVLPHSFQTEHF